MQRLQEAYKKHAQYVKRYCFCLCQNEMIAEELLQQTFYLAVKHIHQFKGQCELKVWLCQIAKHAYFDACRRNGKIKIEMSDQMDTYAGKLQSPEEAFRKKVFIQELLKAVSQLKSPAKEIFLMRSIYEYSYAEIGGIYQRSENWARVTYYRAKNNYRKG